MIHKSVEVRPIFIKIRHVTKTGLQNEEIYEDYHYHSIRPDRFSHYSVYLGQGNELVGSRCRADRWHAFEMPGQTELRI